MDIEMKPQRFEIGQAVTVSRNASWITLIGEDGQCPIFGKIYHVSQYEWLQCYRGWFISLAELAEEDAFNEGNFDPVITTHELESELSEIETGVVV